MITSKKLLVYLIPISLVGCATTRDEQGSVLMEDVVVQRTTVRSTTQNPTPKKNATVFIQGDNITIGTLIVNSPNTRVDNSTNTHQVQQNYNNSSSSNIPSNYKPTNYEDGQHGLFGIVNNTPRKYQEPYNSDRDFFKRAGPQIMMMIPNLLMLRK